MTKKILNALGKSAGVTAGVIIGLALLFLYGLSWIITCGIIKLITVCFGWTFSWGIATGIWLIMCLARTVFNHTVTVKK